MDADGAQVFQDDDAPALKDQPWQVVSRLAAAFTGVFASAFALGMQVWAQARVEPSTSALVLTLEPVFAAVLGYLTGERLGWIGAAGAALILAGVLVSELAPWPRARLQPEAPA